MLGVKYKSIDVLKYSPVFGKVKSFNNLIPLFCRSFPRSGQFPRGADDFSCYSKSGESRRKRANAGLRQLKSNPTENMPMKFDPATIRRFLRDNRILIILLAVGFLLRLAVALPGLCSDPATRFSRPDTRGYLGPAEALAVDGSYLDEPGGTPNCGRAPGFPFFASLVFRTAGSDNIAALVLALIITGTLIPLAVYRAGTVWADRRTGLWACALTTLNLTMIAQSPMLLSDTLFGLLSAIVIACYGEFYRRRDIRFFALALFLAGVGALIRPINSVWLLPALFLLAVMPKLDWRRKLTAALAGTALFLLPLLPWMGRNATLGAGWSIDTNTGAMYHQNGAMLLAKVNGTSFEAEKAKILAELEIEFSDTEKYPDIKSRSDYRLKKFRELIFAHPFAWLPQHFRPHILLPDAPTFFEILGVTSAGRGTMDVMQKEGLFAAVNHYFGGKLWVLLPVVPLLAVTLFLYLLAAWKLVDWIVHLRQNWYWLFLFLAFIEYYFFLPGPIVAPRYQLPALPFLAIMAAMQLPALGRLLKKCRKKTNGAAPQGAAPQNPA